MNKALFLRRNFAIFSLFCLAFASCEGPTSSKDAVPAVADYSITGLEQSFDGTPKAVTITPKEGKSEGTVTVYYEGTDGTTYAKSKTAPSAVGKYTVTFDVDAAAGFSEVAGLSARTLTISAGSVDPGASDFNISGFEQTHDGSPKAVTITPKEGKSGGAITIYYEGTSGTIYAKSEAAPADGGKYAVTFDVAGGESFNTATGLTAGTLTIALASISDTGDIWDYLLSLTEGSPVKPSLLKLVGMNIDEVWASVNALVQSSKRYVVIDLAACYYPGNTIGDSEHDNFPSIIKDNQYINGIILLDSLTRH